MARSPRVAQQSLRTCAEKPHDTQSAPHYLRIIPLLVVTPLTGRGSLFWRQNEVNHLVFDTPTAHPFVRAALVENSIEMVDIES